MPGEEERRELKKKDKKVDFIEDSELMLPSEEEEE